VEEPSHRGSRQSVGHVLELVDGLKMALEVLEPVEFPMRRRELDGLADRPERRRRRTANCSSALVRGRA
jgi:hypothetical protein